MRTPLLKKEPHVLFLTSWYKTPEAPVFGAFFEEQARALKRAGCQVGIIYPEYIPPSEIFSTIHEVLHDFYVDDGIPTFHIKAFSGVPRMRRLNYYRFSKVVNEVYLKYQETFGTPDVIHAHSAFHAGIAGSHISSKNKIPFVITEYLTSFHLGFINSQSDLNACRRIYNTAQASLIVSNHFKKELELKLNLPDETFKVVPHMVNSIFFDNAFKQNYIQGDPFKFFTNSLLVPRKNVKIIIDAVKILCSKNINVTLKIGGEGPEESMLRDYIQKSGSSDRIQFAGVLKRNEVKDELDACHAFVLGSSYETFGVVLIESMACGRPVVLTNSSGPVEFIGPDQGIIVENHNSQDLAEAMESMIKNYNNYDQDAIREYCRNKFGEDIIVNELLSIYASVLNHSPTSNVLTI